MRAIAINFVLWALVIGISSYLFFMAAQNLRAQPLSDEWFSISCHSIHNSNKKIGYLCDDGLQYWIAK